MYYYIYDYNLLSDSKFEKEMNRIEGRLTDLGIDGKIGRFPVLNGAKRAVEDEKRKGVNTAVIVGNDKTVQEALSVLADTDIVIGIIPIGKNNRIADLLGIKGIEEVCDMLAARTIEVLDIGTVNNTYFFGCLEVLDPHTEIICNDSYSLSLTDRKERFNIYNAGCICGLDAVSDPKDGLLEVSLVGEDGGFRSLLKKVTIDKTRCYLGLDNIKIRAKDPISVKVDCYRTIEDRDFDIGIRPKRLKMIVGKNRRI